MYLQQLRRSSSTSGDNHSSPSTSEQGSSCILCGSKDRRMMQYGNLGSKEQQFLFQHIDSPLFETNFICNSHYVEAQRHHNNPDFIPKWKKSNTCGEV